MLGPRIREAYRDSVLHRTKQAFARAPRLLSHGSDGYEALSEYARKCDAATGITVPRFSCGNGTEVPGQETQGGKACQRPNVLNHECDLGSRFQVLPGRTQDAWRSRTPASSACCANS